MSTINLSWGASSGASTGTFRIKYWTTLDTNNIIVIDNVVGTTYSITGIDNTKTYNGTIESRCIDGSYSSPISWTVAPSSGGGGGGGGTPSESTYTGINSANCSGGSSGTIVIVSNSANAVRLQTTYYSGTNTQPGATMVILDDQGGIVSQLTAYATQLYTPATATSAQLPAGNYTYTLSAVNCNNGSGFSSFTLVTI